MSDKTLEMSHSIYHILYKLYINYIWLLYSTILVSFESNELTNILQEHIQEMSDKTLEMSHNILHWTQTTINFIFFQLY